MRLGPGLFGKLPETGDFVSRGLDTTVRRALDRWVTRNLATRLNGWPKGGLRGLLEIEGGLVLMLAVPSTDKPGRRFPLVAVTDGAGLTLEIADTWCDAALGEVERAAAGVAGLDPVLNWLGKIEPRHRDGPDGAAALWVSGEPPMPCDTETIAALFSSD